METELIHAGLVREGMTLLDAAGHPRAVIFVATSPDGLLCIELDTSAPIEVDANRARRCPVFRVLP